VIALVPSATAAQVLGVAPAGAAVTFGIRLPSPPDPAARLYSVQNSQALLRTQRRLRAGRLPVSRTVVLLGLTSLFTDISAEMVATVLPLYLLYTVGLTPLQFGLIDGLYRGAAAFLQLAGGIVSDRWRRYKAVAFVGYGMSAVCKLGLLAAGSTAALSAIVFADRTGKGIRTAPRDALISLSSQRSELATAFGVHRALDTFGALLGPLIAFGILTVATDSFDSIFVVSFCFALLGLGVLGLFVDGRPPLESEPQDRVSFADARRLLPSGRFRVIVFAGALLALTTVSDGFVYIGLQKHLEFEPSFFPLLFVGTAIGYMTLAVPFGRLADRVGRGRVFLGGYALLLLVYSSLLLPPAGTPVLLVYLVLFGAHYAATEGVLMALASDVLPAGLRATGLALLSTVTSLARLAGSILFGGLWTAFGLQVAVLGFACALVAAICLAAYALRRSGGRVATA
jgi:MFS family permease